VAMLPVSTATSAAAATEIANVLLGIPLPDMLLAQITGDGTRGQRCKSSQLVPSAI
jgi:hypothetical protein